MRLACDASGGTGVDCGWSGSEGVASQFVRFNADVRCLESSLSLPSEPAALDLVN
eukprot:COSAG05_NODE_2342_length_3204_cov_5.613205_5_plen_55_part_00